MQNLQNILKKLDEYNVRLTVSQGRYGPEHFAFLTRTHDDSLGNSDLAFDVLLTGPEDGWYALRECSRQLWWFPVACDTDLVKALTNLNERLLQVDPENVAVWWKAYDRLIRALLDDFVVQPHLAQMQTPEAALAILPEPSETDD